jgi:uncharacterized protein (DUF427 family)
VKARWNGTIVAESEETVEARGYHYFPREAVRAELLRATARTERDLECPHGVQFYDVVVDGAVAERAAWSYEAPQRELGPVEGWFGFWHEIELEV